MTTAADLARVLNLSVRRVYQLVEAGVLPRAARGQFALGECLAAFIRHLQKQVERKQGDPLMRSARKKLLRQRTRLTAAQAEGAATKAAAMAGDLVRLSQVEREFGALTAAIADYGRSLPAELAAATEGQNTAQRQQIIARAMHDWLDFALTWRPGGRER